MNRNRNKITVGVDGNEANVENRVGVNTYAFETLKAISELAVSESIKFEVFLREDPKMHMPQENDNFKYKILQGQGMWILKTLTPYLYKNHKKYDVFWSPSHYVPPVFSIPLVCSIMDLGYLSFKDQFRKYDYWQLKIWTAFSLFVSKKIFAISSATRLDIEKHYPYVKGKIETTLLGYEASRFNTEIKQKSIDNIKKKYNIERDYVLFLSTLKPSKNIEGLLRAWHKIHRVFPEVKLVVAGKKGWLFENIFDLTKKLKLENSVLFTDFIQESEKPALVAGAKVFVLPSFWEGFGLDVLSSLACGVPAIVSNKGSLPEVAGSAGILTDPYDPEDIASAISRVLTMKATEYKALSTKGIKWAHEFKWEKTARETINVLKSAISL